MLILLCKLVYYFQTSRLYNLYKAAKPFQIIADKTKQIKHVLMVARVDRGEQITAKILA